MTRALHQCTEGALYCHRIPFPTSDNCLRRRCLHPGKNHMSPRTSHLRRLFPYIPGCNPPQRSFGAHTAPPSPKGHRHTFRWFPCNRCSFVAHPHISPPEYLPRRRLPPCPHTLQGMTPLKIPPGAIPLLNPCSPFPLSSSWTGGPGRRQTMCIFDAMLALLFRQKILQKPASQEKRYHLSPCVRSEAEAVSANAIRAL